MNCSCINGKYRINVTSFSQDFFIYEDISDWMTDSYYIIPDMYTVNILPPGSSKYISVDVYTNRSNMIDSKILFGTNECNIPDGIYCFKVDNCGVVYSAYAAITEKLECGIRNILINAIQTNRKDEFELVNRLQLMVDGIKVFARMNNLQDARSAYDYVKKTVYQLKCNCL